MDKHRVSPLAILLSVLLTSCASIMTGSTDNVTIESIPSGAFFTTNTGSSGHTPQMISVPASQDLVVEYKKNGYEPQSAILKSRMSGWIVGNVIFGGFIGLAIDIVNPDARTHDKSLSVQLVQRDPSEVEAEEPRIQPTSVREMPPEINIVHPPRP